MKHSLVVAGNVYSGLSHFALAGLSLLARSLSDGVVTTHWNNEPTPRGVLETEDIAPEDIAIEIKRLSQSWYQGWTSIRVQYAVGEFSPFSPRFKQIDPRKNPDDWPKHQQARTPALDKLSVDDDHLALQFIHSLGEAAYWRFDGKDPRPDHGASRWEMKTRNQGEEFVSQKLFKYVEALSDWDTKDILAGLTGQRVEDPFGEDASRTPSGFTPPARTDLALAFAALIGIGQFPVSARAQQMTLTPCAYPDTALHTKVAVLPVPTIPLTPERFESIVLSQEWASVVNAFGAEEIGRTPESLLHDSAVTALRQFGAPAAAVFRVHLGGSSLAPERYFESGKVRLL